MNSLSDLIGREYTITVNGITGTARLTDVTVSDCLTELSFDASPALAKAWGRGHESWPVDPANSTFFVVEPSP